MRRLIVLVPILLVSFCLLTGTSPAQQKLAQTGMKFLGISTDARAAALGDAFTAVDGGAASLMYNPAGIARQTMLAEVSFGQVEWIADIKHSYATLAVSPSNGEYGVIGLVFQMADYGDMHQTIRVGNAAGFADLGTFSPKGTSIGLTYARALSEKFSVGGGAKWVRQDLGAGVNAYDEGTNTATEFENKTSVVAFDFGVLYRTGFKSLQFGMAVRNFAKEVKYIDEPFQLPLIFKIGLSMNLLDFADLDPKEHQFLLAIDAEHPRDYPERVRMGGEYRFLDLLSVRAGFVSLADEQKFSYGVGIRKNIESVGLGFDYAYTPSGIFGNVHRFTIQLCWI
jgi:hypothetical protein